MTKRAKIIIGVIAAVVLIGLVGGYLAVKSGGTKVDVAKVKTESLAVTVLGSGKVTAGTKVDVYPESSGLIDTVYVKDGERVEKGAEVLKLQTDALDAQLAQAEAGLAQAKSALAQANFTAATKSASIKAAQASLKAAQDAYDATKSAEQTARSAYQAMPSNPTLKSAYLQAKIATAQAKSALAQAKAGLTQAQSTPASSAKASAQDGVNAAQDSVNIAKRALDKATLRAPMTGVVMYPTASAGASSLAALSGGSSAGATAKSNDNTPVKGAALAQGSVAFSIVDDTKLSFSAEIDEADIEKVKVGQKVEVTLDAFNGKTFKGSVISIGDVAQTNATGGTVFIVEMSLDNQGDATVKLGMKGDSTIEVENLTSALTVPIEALFSEGGKDYVYVIENDKLVKKNITAGTTTDTSVEVIDGLSEGETVALAGSKPLSAGMKVTASTTSTKK